jgi:hypothetical protein
MKFINSNGVSVGVQQIGGDVRIASGFTPLEIGLTLDMKSALLLADLIYELAEQSKELAKAA